MSISVGQTRTIYLSSGSNTNAGNLTYTSPNRYQYSFVTPWDLTYGEYEASVNQLTMPFSWQNINSTYGNTTFSYIFNGATRTCVMEDGFYSYSDIEGFLEAQMIANGDYLLDSNGDYVFFISVVLNTVIYGVTFTLTKIPTTLGTYTNPAGISLSGNAPQLVIPNTAIFDYFGITAGTYPAVVATVTTYVSSDLVPSEQTASTIVVTMNGMFNSLISTFSNALFSFTSAGSLYGALINAPIYNQIWLPLSGGNFTNFTFSFIDQAGHNLSIVDGSQLFIALQIRRTK